MFKIYKITNLINNKVYIGQTSRKLCNRIAEHIYKKTLIGKDIVNYGKVNFSFEVIDYATSKEDADKKEIYYIGYFNCIYPLGYNLSLGGVGCNGCHVGSKNYFYGKRGKDAKNSIPVKCLETDEVFDCIKGCAERFNGDKSQLSKYLKGKGKSFKGYHFILIEG